MNTLNDFAKTVPTAFGIDPANLSDGWKAWADFNARASEIALDFATKSNEIATSTTHETVSRLRDVAVVRDEPADYAKAFGDFAQAQMELTQRTAGAFGNILQQAQTDTSELVSNAGRDAANKAASKTETAARKTAKAANKTSDAA